MSHDPVEMDWGYYVEPYTEAEMDEIIGIRMCRDPQNAEALFLDEFLKYRCRN